MGLGVRGLSDLMPKSDASQRSAQYMQMAQNQKYIPTNEKQKSVGGALQAGLGGVMTGQSLAKLLPAAEKAGEAAGTGAWITNAAAGGLGASGLAPEVAMSGLGPGLAGISGGGAALNGTAGVLGATGAAGATETALAGAAAEGIGASAAAGAGLSMAAAAPWAVGALALGSYLFG